MEKVSAEKVEEDVLAKSLTVPEQEDSKPLVSVIIPVFNKEKYVVQCIESVVGQTYEAIELIVVDDGSTDSSRGLLKEIEGCYKNDLKVIEQTNKGVSAARNAGLIHAKGKYILFLDADDYIISSCVDILVGVAEWSGADLVEFDFSEKGAEPEGQSVEFRPRDTVFIENRTVIMRTLLAGQIKPVVCGGLYKACIAKRIKFIEGMNWGEDSCYKIDFLFSSQSLVCVHYPLYVNRVLYDNTLSRQRISKEQAASIVQMIRHYEDYLGSDVFLDPPLQQKLFKMSVSQLGRMYRENVIGECPDAVSYLESTCEKYKAYSRKDASLLAYRLMRISPHAYVLAFKVTAFIRNISKCFR